MTTATNRNAHEARQGVGNGETTVEPSEAVRSGLRDNERGRNVIGTFTGRLVNPWDMGTAELDIVEIAHALALFNRFGGHTREPYSVAQHSCLVADHCGPRPIDQLAGLLHDATEAYLGDVVTPIKRRPELEGYREAEARLAEAVKIRWALDKADWALVDRVDVAACTSEAQSLFVTSPGWTAGRPSLGVEVRAWDWKRAEGEFLLRFCRLTEALEREGWQPWGHLTKGAA